MSEIIKPNEVYTPQEIQSILKVSERTVRRMIKRGELRSTHIGRQVRILGKELLRVLSVQPEDAGLRGFGRNAKLLLFIQARMSSERLPGKVLKQAHGKPLLSYVVDRVRASSLNDSFAVITSVNPEDDPVESFCVQNCIPHFRGPLEDVAARFISAGEYFGADYFIRLCADSPWADSTIIDTAADLIMTGEWDLVTNAHPRSFPKGLTVEAIALNVFKSRYAGFTPAEKENIFTHFYRNPGEYKIKNIANPMGDFSADNLSIDTPDDFKRFETALAESQGTAASLNWKDAFYAGTKVRHL